LQFSRPRPLGPPAARPAFTIPLHPSLIDNHVFLDASIVVDQEKPFFSSALSRPKQSITLRRAVCFITFFIG
jgi:hypothetical protein